MKANRYLLVLLAGLVLVVGTNAIAANVIKRMQGTYVFDGVVARSALTIGGSGTAIADSYAATLTTAFNGVAANDCKDSAAITVTGAATGDTCTVGADATNAAKDLTFTCYVSAANAAKIHICNPTGSTVTGVASGTYNVRVFDP